MLHECVRIQKIFIMSRSYFNYVIKLKDLNWKHYQRWDKLYTFCMLTFVMNIFFYIVLSFTIITLLVKNRCIYTYIYIGMIRNTTCLSSHSWYKYSVKTETFILLVAVSWFMQYESKYNEIADCLTNINNFKIYSCDTDKCCEKYFRFLHCFSVKYYGWSFPLKSVVFNWRQWWQKQNWTMQMVL